MISSTLKRLDGLDTLLSGVEDGKGKCHFPRPPKRHNDINRLQPNTLEEGQELRLVDVRVEGANENLELILPQGHCATAGGSQQR